MRFALVCSVKRPYVSEQALASVLVTRKARDDISRNSLDKETRLLHDSWHKHKETRPINFVETLMHLLDNGKLSQFDMSFSSNWLQKKSKGHAHKADQQTGSVVVLYRLGESVVVLYR